MKTLRVGKLVLVLYDDFLLPIEGGSSFATTTRNSMLDLLDTLAPFVGAHSAFPGDTGANELSGAPYARQAITYSPAAGASKSASNSPAIPIPGGNTVAFLSGWSLVTAGTFRWWATRAGNVPAPFELDDTTEPDLFRCDNHGLIEDEQVILIDTEGASLPGTFVEGTIYFVDLTGVTDPTDTFKLAATAGGAPIGATSDGAGFVQSIIPQFYATSGTETVDSLTLSLLL